MAEALPNPPRMRSLVALVLLVAALPASARAQPIDNVLTAIREGGGWVSVPIVAGRGTASTVTIPTMNLTLTGCVRVWDGHSGRWQISATEAIADTTLVVRAAPGQGVPFQHTFGLRSQLSVDITWSEPRDTTLFLWVGVKGADDPRDACVPRG